MRTVFCAGLITALTSLPAIAQETPNPVLRTTVNAIWFDNWVGLSNAMLRVASPDGEVETIYEKTRAPTYRLTGARVLDGRYKFELRAATEERVPNTSDLTFSGDDEDVPETLPVPFYMSGAFLVKNGAVVPPDTGEED